MSNSQGSFDPIGIVVDWLDACKERRLSTLVDLYDDGATVGCCDGGTFRGRSELERYWRPKLAHAATGPLRSMRCFRTQTACLSIIEVTMEARYVCISASPTMEKSDTPPAHRLGRQHSQAKAGFPTATMSCGSTRAHTH